MKQVLALLVMICLACSVSTAQIIKRSKEKAKNKTNQRVDDKIEDGIDESLDKIEDLFKRKKSDDDDDSDSSDDSKHENSPPPSDSHSPQNDGQPAEMPFPMGNFGGEEVEVEDQYNFQHSIDMKIDLYDKKGKLEQTMDYTYFLSDDGSLFGMEGGAQGMTMKVVYELESHRMISMTNSSGTKMGFVMDASNTADVEDTDAEPTFRKTGQEREILGRDCEEWVSDEDGYHYQVWITKDNRLAFSHAFSEMSKASKSSGSGYANYPEGFLMEMISTDQKSGEKTVMTVTKINEDQASSITTEGYQFMSFGPQN
jgi:hypothetical protein